MQTAVVAIVVFGVLVFVHELGHYLAARYAGIKVLELAIGIGPRLVGWRRNDINFSIRALPLGGVLPYAGRGPG
jgi:regulator of sigma E protease